MSLQKGGSANVQPDMLYKLQRLQDKPLHSRVLGLPDDDARWNASVRQDAAKAAAAAAWK